MSNIFYSVLPIFLIALLGSVIRRKWLKSDEFWRGLEKLSFYILFPAMLFEHSAKADFRSSEINGLISALIISNLLITASLVIYQAKYNYNKVQFTSVFQGATRYNTYIFFSLGAALLGDPGMTIIASVSPYMLVLTNITAILSFYYYVPQKDYTAKISSILLLLKSIGANPFILASLTGFVYNYLGFDLNSGIDNTIDTIANSAFAIGMLIVGASIRFTVEPEYFKQVLLTSSIKLIITPLVTFFVLWFFGVSGTAKSVGILFSCLPCASSSYMFSRQLGGDPNTMSAIITLSTIFSILSLSILVYILG